MSVVPQTRALTPVAFAATTMCEEALSAAAGVLRSGWVTTGPATARFEAEIASLVQARYAVGTSSCTAAIDLRSGASACPRRRRCWSPR